MILQIRKFLALALALFGLTAALVYTDIIVNAVQSVLHLEVDPSFTGGRIASVHYDPVNDDHGFGGLTYPKSAEFGKGSLDLVRYEVREPLTAAKWGAYPEYWQLVLVFLSGPHDSRNIRIYIDADGDGKGRSTTLNELGEGVGFDPAYPWDYAVSVHGASGQAETADGKSSIPIGVVVSSGGTEVAIQIPLSDPAFRRIFDAKSSRHYVVVGGWSPWGYDSYLPVGSRAKNDAGGGAPSPLTPKIYDCLVPDDSSQEDTLSAWNEDDLSSPTLHPVEMAMRAPPQPGMCARLSGSGDTVPDEATLSSLKEQIAVEAEARAANERSAFNELRERVESAGGIASSSLKEADLQAYAAAAFFAGEKDLASKALKLLLQKNPDNPDALAYSGAILAMRASDEPPLTALETVTEAYVLLDRAVELSKSDDSILASRYSRASTSRAVPNSVFSKALTGAEDYIQIASHIKNDPEELAHVYCDAAVCYETAGRDLDAGLWFREASRLIKGLPPEARGADVKLELAKRRIP